MAEAFNQTHGMQDNTLLNYDTSSIRKRRLDTKLTTQIVPENQIMSRVDSWAKIEDLRVLVVWSRTYHSALPLRVIQAHGLPPFAGLSRRRDPRSR